MTEQFAGGGLTVTFHRQHRIFKRSRGLDWKVNGEVPPMESWGAWFHRSWRLIRDNV